MDSPGFESRSRQEIFLFSHKAWTGCGANHKTPVQWLPGLCPVVKRPGREVNHSSSSIAEFKNDGTMPLLSLYTIMAQTMETLTLYLACSQQTFSECFYWLAHTWLCVSLFFRPYVLKNFRADNQIIITFNPLNTELNPICQ